MAKKMTQSKRPVPGMWLLKHLLIAAGVVVALIAGAFYLLKFGTMHGEEIPVPDFSNMTLSEASDMASIREVRVEVTDSVFVKRMRRGAVYKQNPAAGSRVKKGRRILLTINAVNPKEITMPDLVGHSMRQAKAELLSRGLVLGRLIYVHDIATNNVLRQLYGGEDVEPGAMVESEAVIDLVVGLNSKDSTTYAPYLPGLKYLSAVDAVHDHSLNVGNVVFDETVKDYEDSLNAVVYDQLPMPSDSTFVSMGDSLHLYLTLDHTRIPVLPVEEEVLEEKQEEVLQ